MAPWGLTGPQVDETEVEVDDGEVREREREAGTPSLPPSLVLTGCHPSGSGWSMDGWMMDDQGGPKTVVKLVKGPVTDSGDEECDARITGQSGRL